MAFGTSTAQTTEAKLVELHRILAGMGRVAIAYSGGVDSTFLLAVAKDVLKVGDVLAVNAISPVYSQREQAFAQEFAAKLGVECISLSTRELGDERFAINRPDRCFHCKSELFGRLQDVASERKFPSIADGTTASDLDDFRPGMQARETYGVRSPLLEAGMAKEEIRVLSHEMGLPTWDKPAMACLASRFPYGTGITVQALRQIEKAEEYLFDRGYRQVRVRHHGPIARIEIMADEMVRLLEEAPAVVRRLKALGYRYVALDLQGYRTGSMNEDGSIPLRPLQ
ncbi:MAG: ATP-dependent sacrificial sulfur transferase LarE [Dehalococcoidia bacterium]|jgi:uncharacterized protein|nr:ATP-dependent sacrificial sulfur transferase LarE [Dehalococcoidia bacterium]